MDLVTSDTEGRKRRRRKKRIDEESIDSVSTISKIVEEGKSMEPTDIEIQKKKKPTN